MYFSPLTTRIPVRRFRDEVDRLLSDFLGGIGGGEPLRGSSSMPANVWEDKDNLFVEMELPGVKNEEIDLSVSENTLRVEVEKKTEEAKDVMVHRSERFDGQCSRSLKLPVDVNADEVSASLVNGVLTVTLPKSPLTKPRKIVVQTGEAKSDASGTPEGETG